MIEALIKLFSVERPATKWGHLGDCELYMQIREAYLDMDFDLHRELVQEQDDRWLWDLSL